MTNPTTIPFGLHVAVLDVLSGNGYLVLPYERHDLVLEVGEPTLHHADLRAALELLDGIGWEPSDSDDGGLLLEPVTTSTGRRIAGLYGREPVHAGLSWDDHREAGARVLAEVVATH